MFPCVNAHMHISPLFLEELWKFFCLVVLLVLHVIGSLKGLLLALQLFGWKLRRSIFKGVFALFPDPTKCEGSAAVDCRRCRAVELVHAGGLWQ